MPEIPDYVRMPMLVVACTVAIVLLLWALISRRFVGLGPKLLPRMAYVLAVRNVAGYFSTPTGYVFLCLFVAASSSAAFSTETFYANNLANLDQLSNALPIILLFFIPAITMGIWAEEQQQGTDELLLTMPGTDWEIVLGKFVAAAVIYSASLLFSFLTNYCVLSALALGDVDFGVFAATYVGYWFLGLAMISLGMCASFLTNNLTVAFILAALVNLPLGILLAARFDALGGLSQLYFDFSHGVISLASVLAFSALVVVGLFFSLALIGRRHWLGGRDGESMIPHYIARTAAVVLIALCLVPFLSALADLFNAPLVAAGGPAVVPTPQGARVDLSDGGDNSLSPDTRSLLAGLNSKRPVRIEAFLGGVVPEPYQKARLDLLRTLNEFRARGGRNLEVVIYDNLDLAGEIALRAETQYGIKPEAIQWRDKSGTVHSNDLLMGAAVTCGLQRVVIPFFSSGVPVEYELVRSVATAAQEERRKIGVVRTDASLMGGFEFDGMQPRQKPRQMIVDELEKQYIVEEADPSAPLVDKGYDVLFVVQPSSLAPPQLAMVAQAVEAGVPTAIFEDPYPIFIQVPGTDQPKQGRQQNPFMPAPPQEKGDVRAQLLGQLGIELVGSVSTAPPATPFGPPAGGSQADVIWQKANPYPKVVSSRIFSDEFVFVYPEIKPDAVGALQPFARDNAIVSGLRELLFPFPGALRNRGTSNLHITPLVATGMNSGKLSTNDVREALREMREDSFALERRQGKPDDQQYILAALIESDEAKAAPPTSAPPAAAAASDKPAGDAPAGDAPPAAAKPGETPPATPAKRGIKVVYVCDIDMLANEFLIVRSRPEGDVNWRFQNIPFVLNVLDYLAGDSRFLDIRKRETQYNTLRLVERASDTAWARYQEKLGEFDEQFEKKKTEAEKAMKDAISELEKGVEKLREKEDASIAELNQLIQVLGLRQKNEEQRLQETVKQLTAERKRETDRINRERDATIAGIKNQFRWWAMILPPIPPLVVALIVYLRGLIREAEIVPRARRA